MAIDHSRFY